MKKKNNVKRYICIKALERLNDRLINSAPDFIYEKEVFYFLLDMLYRLPTYNKNIELKNGGYYSISCEYFKKYIGDRKYKKYIDYLLDIDLLMCDESYDIEEHISKGYKLNPAFESKLTTVIIPPIAKVWKSITQNFNSKNHKKTPDYIKRMKVCFKSLEFDIDGANAYITDLFEKGEISINQFNIYLLSISSLNDKQQLYFKRNTTNNRIDTNLTNLKKELRNFLKGDFSLIDLANSQPYLFNYIIKSYLEGISSSDTNTINKPLQPFIEKLFKQFKNPPKLNLKEVEKYNRLTKEGTIYDLFIDKFKIERSEAKKLFLATMYSPNHSKRFREEKKVFKAEFPSIYSFICKLKKKEYNKLAIALQELEAEIFIDNIARRIIEAGIGVYTIHDSVLVKRQNCDQAMNLMKDVFLEYFGEIPTFKTEDLSPLNLKPKRICEIHNLEGVEFIDGELFLTESEQQVYKLFSEISYYKHLELCS